MGEVKFQLTLVDNEGIPVTIHSEHNKYVPELIFGELLTGSSFDDNEEKVTGGRNGLGMLRVLHSLKVRCQTCQYLFN